MDYNLIIGGGGGGRRNKYLSPLLNIQTVLENFMIYIK